MMSASSPYAQALLDYWGGRPEVEYTIHRDDGWSQAVSAAPAFASPPFNAIEQLALERSTGRILEVGAGVGRHALALASQQANVVSLEIEPELVAVMSARGVPAPVDGDLFSAAGGDLGQFDTILMLLNGFGLIGTLARAGAFFARADELLSAGGQILCDSLDVRATSNPTHLAYQAANLRRGEPAGQMRFAIEYGGRCGEPFAWLHLDFDALRALAHEHGWEAERLAAEENGHYLARLTRSRVPSDSGIVASQATQGR